MLQLEWLAIRSSLLSFECGLAIAITDAYLTVYTYSRYDNKWEWENIWKSYSSLRSILRNCGLNLIVITYWYEETLWSSYFCFEYFVNLQQRQIQFQSCEICVFVNFMTRETGSGRGEAMELLTKRFSAWFSCSKLQQQFIRKDGHRVTIYVRFISR